MPNGGRLATGDDLAALLVDGHFHLVDLGVVHDDRLTLRRVALDERPHGVIDLLFDEPAHLQHERADFFELSVVLTRNMSMNRFHRHFLSRGLSRNAR